MLVFPTFIPLQICLSSSLLCFVNQSQVKKLASFLPAHKSTEGDEEGLLVRDIVGLLVGLLVGGMPLKVVVILNS